MVERQSMKGGTHEKETGSDSPGRIDDLRSYRYQCRIRANGRGAPPRHSRPTLEVGQG
jgi:hypothetical protein